MGKMGKSIVGAAAIVAFIGVVASCNGNDDGGMAKADPPAASTTHTGKDASKGKGKGSVSQATTFRDCVAKNGTASEKAAVQHVTKVTGTDERNNILDAPEVYTDFTGGIMSADQGKAKLIATAFASCYDSDNGLVTIYGADGEVMANGNF